MDLEKALQSLEDWDTGDLIAEVEWHHLFEDRYGNLDRPMVEVDGVLYPTDSKGNPDVHAWCTDTSACGADDCLYGPSS